MKPDQNIFLDEFENGSCWIKSLVTRSIVRKPYVCYRGHIFSPIIMKLDQRVFLDEISQKFENGSCRVKN